MVDVQSLGPADSVTAPDRLHAAPSIRPDRQATIIALVFVGVTAATIGIMGLLGFVIVRQYRYIQINSAADAGSLYVEGILAPHAHSLVVSGASPSQSAVEIQGHLDRLPDAGRLAALKIWALNGELLFTTSGQTENQAHRTREAQQILTGAVHAELYTTVDPADPTSLQPPYLEIFSPIRNPADQTLVAFGEIYQDATEFLRQRTVIERSIWLSIGGSTLALLALLLLVAKQRLVAVRHLTVARMNADENRSLMIAAQRARLTASQSNEHLLNQLGAELHDGPIQMLSLMMLMGDTGGETPQGLSPREVGDQVMSDLRDISSGLILPEIHDLSTEQTIRLAISRHESFTNTTVTAQLQDLPETTDYALKICVYRLVQEGLVNAFKHAGGHGQRVMATADHTQITITVSDHGERDDTARRTRKGRGGLGLQGLRNRLEVFNGTLHVQKNQTNGTDLTARIPLG